VLAILSPFVLVVRAWRAWRRGPDPRSSIDVGKVMNSAGKALCRVDLAFDVPRATEPDFRRRLTDAVVQVAESIREDDDVYHLACRLPWEEEPVVLPVGPQLQELGERFSLVQSQGKLAGRTVVWLTLANDCALAEVLDPETYDPEGDGEPDALLIHPDVRWSMATEWAHAGPSAVIRLILVVPSEKADRVKMLFESLT
jgi:hypothetical protein